MDIQEPQEETETFKERLLSVFEIPSKLILASTLIIMNTFQTIAQERELNKILKAVKENYETVAEAKEELNKYLQEFKSVNSYQCPVMIREYTTKGEVQAYKFGLIINGDYTWVQAIGKIRQHLKIDQHTSVSFFCGRIVLNNSTVREFYEKYKHQDGILYVQYLKLESYG